MHSLIFDNGDFLYTGDREEFREEFISVFPHQNCPCVELKMGKVKKLRQKYHMTLKKSKSLGSLPENLENSCYEKRKSDLFKSNENIFAGLDISFDELTKSLPKDFDVRSIVSTKSRREIKEEEKHLKKKEKQKRRHDRFLNSK